ncbi:MAG: DUF1566 domain-containing protein [Deltaproteobacteria bacterium]|nr:DUF1566 domain-containing protein [Deltaproteobacteria bacterium]
MVVIAVWAILVGTFIAAKCATAGETGRDGRFIAYDNGTVLDTSSNLMWAAKDNGSDINWTNAKSYCQNYRGGGYTDWRMPTQVELGNLYDDSVKGHNGYNLTTLITLTACCPWTSDAIRSNATRVNFTNGGRRMTPQSADSGARILPVRSGK